MSGRMKARLARLVILVALLSLLIECRCARRKLKFKNLAFKNQTVTPEEMAKYERDPSYWQPKVDFIYHVAERPQPRSAGVSFVAPSNDSARIAGGIRAKPKQFPWQTLIIIDQGWLCGGFLISTEWVLTAAHCIDEGSSFFVAAGGVDQLNDREKGKQTYLSKIAKMHENYNRAVAHNDIALVKVKFVLSQDVNIIRLPPYSYGANKFENLDNVLLSGYGQTADDGDYSRYLMYVYMQTITNNVCARLYAPQYIFNSILCTGPDGKKASCYGDSGSALMIQDKDKKFTVIGIVSVGPYLCMNYVSTYTRVTSFLGWISKNTGIKIQT